MSRLNILGRRLAAGPAAVDAVAFHTVRGVVPIIGTEASWPPAEYRLSDNRTYFTFERVVYRSQSVASIGYFDHTAGALSTVYDIAPWGNPDDVHGQPAVMIDGSGYLWAFYGSHATNQKWSRSKSPGDIKEWVAQSDIAGKFSYPKPVMLGGVAYLFNRETDAGDTKRTFIVRSGTPSAGSLAFGSSTTLVDFGADSRIYASAVHPKSGKLHFAFTVSNFSDTSRRGIYYAVYSPTTGAIEDIGGSVVAASGALPVSRVTADSSLRLVELASPLRTSHVSMQMDSNGNPHLLYVSGSGSSFDLHHTWHNGSAWLTNTGLATITDSLPSTGFVRHYGLVPGASGKMWAWYPQGFSGGWRGGARIVRREWGGSSWGLAQQMGSTGGDYFGNPTAVRNAHADMRTILATVQQSYDYSNASPLEEDPATVSLLAHGDSGYIPAPAVQSVQYPTGDDLIRIQVADDGVIRDVSWAFHNVMTVNSVAVSSGKMVFNGTNSYIQANSSAAWTLDGDFTAIMGVKFGTDTGHAALFQYGNFSGVLPQGWRLFHNGAGYHFITDDADGSGPAARLSHTAARSTAAETMIAIERKSGTLRLFINNLTAGNEVADAAWAGVTESPSDPLTIGAERSITQPGELWRYLDGVVSIFRLSHRAEIS